MKFHPACTNIKRTFKLGAIKIQPRSREANRRTMKFNNDSVKGEKYYFIIADLTAFPFRIYSFNDFWC